MPDTKFSFRALREHIRKYLWIYIVGIVACLVLSSLLWTTTRPRVPNEQNVTVYLTDGYANSDPLADVARACCRIRTQRCTSRGATVPRECSAFQRRSGIIDSHFSGIQTYGNRYRLHAILYSAYIMK